MGEALHRQRQPATPRGARDPVAEEPAGLRRQRQTALSASGRRRCIRQRRHAWGARCAGSPRGVARGRLAIAAGQREKDHRLCREFAVVAADQLGRVVQPTGHDRHPAEIGRHADRRVFLRDDRALAGHGGAVEHDAPDPQLCRLRGQQGSGGSAGLARRRPPRSTRSTSRFPH